MKAVSSRSRLSLADGGASGSSAQISSKYQYIMEEGGGALFEEPWFTPTVREEILITRQAVCV
jgi:hypothetical protein